MRCSVVRKRVELLRCTVVQEAVAAGLVPLALTRSFRKLVCIWQSGTIIPGCQEKCGLRSRNSELNRPALCQRGNTEVERTDTNADEIIGFHCADSPGDQKKRVIKIADVVRLLRLPPSCSEKVSLTGLRIPCE